MLALLIVLMLCACGSGKSVELNADNIENYLNISGEYTNSKVTNALVGNLSSSDIALETYAVRSGSFENVEITLCAEGGPKNALGDSWHLTGSEDDKIAITIKLPADGSFSDTYNISCMFTTQKLTGECKLTVVSASGTFVPG